ncbi:MAG TPA: XdhC family protein [Anaerolineales bacterium]|nr:XdhC family protein [Anaerolineales bacterium]
MYELIETLQIWQASHLRIAMATVVQTWGSSPRAVGSKMLVNPDGAFSGSVSGGCVENAVIETALTVLEDHQPQLLHFGVADESAWEVGLACGGQIRVLVQVLPADIAQDILAALRQRQAFALLSSLSPNLAESPIFLPIPTTTPSAQFSPSVWQALTAPSVSAVHDNDLVDVVLPPTRLLVVGGGHISIALIRLANILGFETILIDPRRAFANRDRFPHASQIINDWPDHALADLHVDSSTAIAALTHDPKIDDPGLKVALQSAAFYVGALGSTKTQVARRERLFAEGLPPAQLDRLHAPIGLNLGGRSAEEIALAVLAEIVAVRNKKIV